MGSGSVRAKNARKRSASERKSASTEAATRAEDNSSFKKPEKVFFFEVNEERIIADPNFLKPKVNSDLYDLIWLEALTTPKVIISEIEFYSDLVWHFRRLAWDKHDELIGSIDLHDLRDNKALEHRKRLIEALEDEDDGWKEWIKIEGKEGVAHFKKEILDWLAAPIEWHEDMPDKATPVGSAKIYFEHALNDTERNALGVSIVEFSTMSGGAFSAAVLKNKIEEANEIAKGQGQDFRFRPKTDDELWL
jgi:hypothetical protein